MQPYGFHQAALERTKVHVHLNKCKEVGGGPRLQVAILRTLANRKKA